MARQLSFVPFTGFSPGGAGHGQGLDRATNLLPIHGGLRSLQKKSIQAAEAGAADPFTGLFVHIFADTRTVQFLRPDADTTPGIWEPSEQTDDVDVLWAMVDGKSPNDSDYIIAPGAPDAEAVVLALSDATAPAVLTDHKILWRYQVEGYAAQKSGGVTSITRSGTTATVTTAAAHGLSTGDVSVIAGANQPEYNIAAKATVTSTTKYTYEVSGTPASPATGTITWKEGWKIKMDLLEAGTVVDPGSDPVEDEAIGGASTSSPGTRTENLTSTVGGQADTITDYNDLSVRFTATVPGAVQELRPSSDDSVGGWTTAGGASTNLYQQIDEAVASDADYIDSNALTVGSSRTYRATLGAGESPEILTGHTLSYRYYATNAGMDLVVSLKQGTTTVKTTTHNQVASGAWTAGTFTLSSAEAEDITDPADLRVEFRASYPSSVEIDSFNYARPSLDVSNVGWKNESETTLNLYQSIDETAPDNFTTEIHINASFGAPSYPYETSLSSVEDPLVDSGHKLRIRYFRQTNSTFTRDIAVQLKQGSSIIATGSFRTEDQTGDTAQWFWKEIALTEAQAGSITNYGDLRVLFTTTVDGYGGRITTVELEVPKPRSLRVSWAELELPSLARASVTWTEMQVPSADTEYRGDVPTIYAGKTTNLYTADATGFTSVGSGYASGTLKPGGWYFTSWGEDVVATNYANDVQIRRAGAGSFGTMITSTDVPKARFVATIRNFVQLGDINLAGHTADEVWWSAFEDETDFDPSITTLCDYQPLKATQGQVMGMVGGEYGVIFKRNAIHLQTWVGSPTVFRFDTTSRSVGTEAPRSIVSADGLIYFWDGSSFRKTTGYEEPQRIGNDILSRLINDFEFSDEAIAAYEPVDIREEDLMFSGAYDPRSGLIAWTYFGKDDTEPSRKGRVLFYNPRTEAWSFGKVGAGLDLTQLATFPNTLNDDTHILKGLIGVSYDGTDRAWFKMASATTYEATLRTKRLTLGDDSTVSSRIHGVYPIFEVKNDADLPANITIELEASNDPRFVTNVRSESYTTAKANEYMQFPHRLEAKWYRFTVTVPELTAKVLTSFLGLYVEWQPGGEK